MSFTFEIVLVALFLGLHYSRAQTWNLCYSNQKCSGFSGSCSSVTSVAGCQSICNNLNTGGTPTYPYLQYNAASSPTCCCILGQTCSGLVADSGGNIHGEKLWLSACAYRCTFGKTIIASCSKCQTFNSSTNKNSK